MKTFVSICLAFFLHAGISNQEKGGGSTSQSQTTSTSPIQTSSTSTSPIQTTSTSTSPIQTTSTYPGQTFTLESESSSSSTSSTSLNSSSGVAKDCNCSLDDFTVYQLEKALRMQEQIKNKTGLLSKLHHRATHSEDAMWASITLSALLVLLFVSVLQSKMWKERTFISYADSQPVSFDQFNHQSEISIKRMLRSRARSLSTAFKKSVRGGPEVLSMERFLDQQDTVDSSHQALLDSSSSSDDDDDPCSSSSSTESEAEIYRMNKYTGEWETGVEGAGLLSKRPKRTTSGYKKGGRVRRRARAGSEEPVLDSSLARELHRQSSSSDEESKSLMRIG